MKNQLLKLAFEVEIEEGEQLNLPSSIVQGIGKGKWSSKKRPVLILWVDGDDVIVTAVTSAMPRTQTDILLKDWANSGLRVPSTVRLSRLDCLEKKLTAC